MLPVTISRLWFFDFSGFLGYVILSRNLQKLLQWTHNGFSFGLNMHIIERLLDPYWISIFFAWSPGTNPTMHYDLSKPHNMFQTLHVTHLTTTYLSAKSRWILMLQRAYQTFLTRLCLHHSSMTSFAAFKYDSHVSQSGIGRPKVSDFYFVVMLITL